MTIDIPHRIEILGKEYRDLDQMITKLDIKLQSFNKTLLNISVKFEAKLQSVLRRIEKIETQLNIHTNLPTFKVGDNVFNKLSNNDEVIVEVIGDYAITNKSEEENGWERLVELASLSQIKKGEERET